MPVYVIFAPVASVIHRPDVTSGPFGHEEARSATSADKERPIAKLMTASQLVSRWMYPARAIPKQTRIAKPPKEERSEFRTGKETGRDK